MEILGFGVLGLGALIFFIGWIWLLVTAFKVGGALWGIINIFAQPVTGIVFCIMHKTGWGALGLMIVGLVIQLGGLIPILISKMDQIPR